MTITALNTPVIPPRTTGTLPITIIGAGPVGLAAAANLVERGLDFEVIERGDRVAESMRAWGHIRLFSPWRHLIDPAARRLLEADGWTEPRDLDAAPLASELIRDYLEPLAALPAIAAALRLRTEVLAVTREGADRTRSTDRASKPFVVRVRDADGVRDLRGRAVIDASGTYGSSNSLGSNGLDPIGLEQVEAHLSHALPDVTGAERDRFAGKHVTVVGAGHSAANTLLNLAELIKTAPETQVTWVIRNAKAVRVFTAETDELERRASLGSRLQKLIDFGVIEVVDGFEILALDPQEGRVAITGTREGSVRQVTTDVVVNATGFRPDLGILREVRLELDDVVEGPRRLAPLIDPNLHSCGTVEPHGFAELQQPEPDFFIAGMKSYGRAPTFLLATGYEQVRSITAYLAGDLAAATKVELVLPATGVCSTTLPVQASCCS